MILRFQTKIDRNGNKLQLEIDTTAETVKKGYFLFVDSGVTILATKKDLCNLFENVFFEYVTTKKAKNSIIGG